MSVDTGAAPELIVICACCNYDSVKVIDQHVAEHLSRLGPVLYVDPPMSLLTPIRHSGSSVTAKGPRLRMIAPNLWRLTPVVAPFPSRQVMLPLTEVTVRRLIRSAVGRIGLPPWCVLSGWSGVSPFGAADERLAAWWAQDDYAAAVDGGLVPGRAGRVAADEHSRAAESDVVVAVSPGIRDRWSDAGFDVVMIPNGTEPSEPIAAQRAALPGGVELRAPVAIMMGRFNRRTDPALLHAVLDHGSSLLLVGPDAGAPWLEALTLRPGVLWVGEQPHSALPQYLALADVGLVPYADTPFNRASFPIKMLEYAAAGLPSVVSDFPAARWLQADPDILRIAPGADEFGRAVCELSRGTSAELRERCRALARAHSYERRSLELIDALAMRGGREGSTFWRARAAGARRSDRG